MHSLTLLVGAFALVSFAIFTVLTKRAAKKTGVAAIPMPGPTQLPIIGRIHDLPIDYMWLKFKEWADIYGPIYQTSMLGTKFVVISDEKVCEELLVKRAKIYSDRPAVPSLFQSKIEYLPLMGKNQYWSRQRKFTHAYLTEASNAHYHGIMEHEAKRWMFRLLTEPDKFQQSLDDMASKVMCTLTWDQHDFSEYYSKSAWGLLTQMSPAGPITNVLTPLWKLPTFMNPWKIAEHKRHDEQNAFWLTRLIETRERMKQGTQRPCFTRQYLQSPSTALSGDVEASICIGMMALVGIFTVSGPLNYFIVCMIHFPEWQRKVQEELDRVCGERMPTVADTPNLPILRAIIKETMRWKPNVPTGVAHEVEADDYYRGYLIEKGTRILPLDWAFLKNPVKYPDPENFRPERWLEPGWPTFQEPLTQYPTIKGMSSFGWGQRTCLGQQVTQDELVVGCGAMVSCFNIKHRMDPNTGKELPVPLNKSNSLLIIKPDPYLMTFEARSEAKRETIIKQWQESDAKEEAQKSGFIAAARTANAALAEKAALEAAALAA